MRILSVLLLPLCLANGVSSFAQGSITLHIRLARLQTVFDLIEKQTEYRFFYDYLKLVKSVPVSVDLDHVPLKAALDACLLGQPVTYSFDDKTILIVERVDIYGSIGHSELHAKPDSGTGMRGVIVNERGEPLGGATLVVRGEGKTEVSDAQGRFFIKGLAPGVVVEISYTGYQTSLIRLEGTSANSIVLKTAVGLLDQVQVIGYGTTTKRLDIGGAGMVSGQDLAESPVSNSLAGLEGRITGLQITQQSGVPGGGFRIQIRGQNSLRNASLLGPGVVEGNNPFYVIDGVPYPASSLQTISAANGSANNATLGSPLNFINPWDIENIAILKDAEATAIYGSRGSNGVILITTRKGHSGKLNANIMTRSGFGEVSRTQRYLNLRQYLDTRYEAFVNDGAKPALYDYDVNGSWDSTRYTDWQKSLIGGHAQYADAMVSFSAGGPHAQFSWGGGYHRESTVFPGDFADQRGSFHFATNLQPENSGLHAGLILNFLSDNNRLPEADLSASSVLAPDAPLVFDASRHLNWSGGFANPFQYLLQPYTDQTTNLIGALPIRYELIPGLEIKTDLGYAQTWTNESLEIPISSLNPDLGSHTGSVQKNTTSSQNWIIEPELSYTRSIGKGKVEALMGGTIQENSVHLTLIHAQGFLSDDLLNILADAPTINATVSNVLYRYNALFGRIRYNLAERYLVNLSTRRDGSSRFGPGKQYATFGAAGAAWIFSEAAAIKKSIPSLSFGKLHLTYGSTGSDQIGDYQYYSTYQSTTFTFGGLPGLRPVQLFNPDFSWEVTKKWEGGLDLGWFHDRVVLSGRYYRDRSTNQLVGYPLSTVTGFSSIEGNFPALVQNTGWEFELNTILVKNERTAWSSTINLTIPDNKLLSFPNIANTVFNTVYEVGKPLTVFKGFRFDGVAPGTGQYQFLTGKGAPTYAPTAPTDNRYTRFRGTYYYGGWQQKLKFRQIQVDLLLQFVRQTGTNNLYEGLPGASVNEPVTVLSRWRQPGDLTGIQRFNQDYSLYAAATIARLSSDHAVGDASFARVKNLSVSYLLPKTWMHKAHAQEGRIFLQAQNLITVTNYLGADPENQNPAALPPLRTVVLGMQCTL